MKSPAIVPNMAEYVRNVTDHGPVKSILLSLRHLSLPNLVSLTLSQIPYLLLLAKKDFASGLLLLTQIKLLQSLQGKGPNPDRIILDQPAVDLALALKNRQVFDRFASLCRTYFKKPVFATANLEKLTEFLKKSGLKADIVSIHSLKKNPGRISARAFEIPVLSIIIPVFNEEKTILKILDRLLSCRILANLQIIIVNDGSTDRTSQVLRDMLANPKIHFLKKLTQPALGIPKGIMGLSSAGEYVDSAQSITSSHKEKRATIGSEKNSIEGRPEIILLNHNHNQGKGATIRTGLKYATGSFTVIQDADLEYNPNDLQRLLSYLQYSASPVVYGSRRLGNHNIHYATKFFYLGGILLNHITNLLYHQHLTDEATCYKMFKTSFLKSLPLKCKRFEFCPEVTALTSLKGHRITEIPISYSPRSISEGKKIRLIDGLEAIATLVSHRFRSL